MEREELIIFNNDFYTNYNLKPVPVCQRTQFVLILETNLVKAIYGNSGYLLL
jgi:hypothetical protein